MEEAEEEWNGDATEVRRDLCDGGWLGGRERAECDRRESGLS